jgi:hypothetical protein
MPRLHARRHRFDRGPVADVADLSLAVDLGRERLQPILPPCDEEAAPAAPGQLARGRLSDPGRGARDER